MVFGRGRTIDGFSLDDPRPETPLDEILPYALRAECCLVRNSHSAVLETNFVQIVGAIDMMAGLQYHHDKFALASIALGGNLEHPKEADHEAIAYLNRMGQFRTFCRSPFVRSQIANVPALVPTIEKFIVFRNKVSAHRSIDDPRGETEGAQLNHARALTWLGARLYSPRPGATFGDVAAPRDGSDVLRYLSEIRARGYLGYQIYDDSNGTHLSFHPEREHPAIISECYSVVCTLLTGQQPYEAHSPASTHKG